MLLTATIEGMRGKNIIAMHPKVAPSCDKKQFIRMSDWTAPEHGSTTCLGYQSGNDSPKQSKGAASFWSSSHMLMFPQRLLNWSGRKRIILLLLGDLG